MTQSQSRPSRWHILLSAAVLIGCLSAQTACADDGYTPGPVVFLHTWLGGQCSFVPDLDVADCCAEHDMAYQDPSSYPFPGTSPGTERHRRAADLAFRQCILSKNRFIVGHIYYAGVRAFGWLFYTYN